MASTNLLKVQSSVLDFVDSCQYNDLSFRLTRNSDTSPFALCFAIFNYHLLGCSDKLSRYRSIWTSTLIDNFNLYISDKSSHLYSKPVLQLQTFTLSALSILGALDNKPLSSFAQQFTSLNITEYLDHFGTSSGAPKSGNMAMFLGINLIYLRDFIGIDTSQSLTEWVNYHLDSRNQYGMWGSNSYDYLQFQNGYHQYEILSYLDYLPSDTSFLTNPILELSDVRGHFAPYPGGGGCYDYDAVSLITRNSHLSMKDGDKLSLLMRSILSEQNPDGGFCESLLVRPLSPSSILAMLSHSITSPTFNISVYKLIFNLNLLRPKHSRIHTHWSKYSRFWFESDLWNTWFRLQTIAKIQIYFQPSLSNSWNFIDFPGIGYF